MMLDFITKPLMKLITLYNTSDKWLRRVTLGILIAIIILIISYSASFIIKSLKKSGDTDNKIIEGKNINNAPNYGNQHIGDNK